MKQTASDRFVTTAFCFEAALGIGALGFGTLVGFDALASVGNKWSAVSDNLAAMWWGVVGVFPLAGVMLLVERVSIAPIARLRELVDRQLVPLFSSLSAFELAAISFAAGFGEEVLFRGLLQAGLAAWIGPPAGVVIGLLIASVVFGVCHWLTPTYALLAGLVGLYLGALFLWTGNLLAPLTAHALYDFLALLYLVRLRHADPAELKQ